MHVVIMGCGRVGASLASGLERLGHEVAVIDRDPQAFRRLGPDFRGRQVVGFGFHRSVLDEAGLESADAFAAVSSGDNSNIIAARVARESYGVGKVVARIYDAKRAAVYERLGIPTVATVPWTTDRLLRMLLPDGVATAWREPTGTVAVLPLPLHEDWVGRPIRDLERATNSRVAFIVRFGTGVLPTKDTTVQHEDTVYVAAVSGTVSDVTAAAAAPPEED
ncbi:potassium channel family protein [Pseudonocardia alni]|jgi:trk system potassium uptake protein TrkA|uniref:Trk system potassium uptake protein TrkA n=1 Tax=Pseudonocardia alni TaxID=33907 RepID=A0A852VWL7_PSEA5|nr:MULTISPECIES: TrkA family potassium uptake protein [Pseudonocardia]OJG05065.1 Trk system potassium uptake protein TrkA [Pseudonocardia autotrophica]MCO7194052.1 TrkA family potassium uptake protein [Pseudonocardia sp. McavD-2-B]MYW74829.1 NAD-binding protein [Pseudonocardia sp. SID8383]NYG00420.1 trk system potassium uptake protein TrkA [Pseudonocardia antarctica]PKB33806.1 trk system potassium uptake protein TrkA [Pseudonocardia alni]